jgi:mannose-6-phosphate isomerase class I
MKTLLEKIKNQTENSEILITIWKDYYDLNIFLKQDEATANKNADKIIKDLKEDINNQKIELFRIISKDLETD